MRHQTHHDIGSHLKRAVDIVGSQSKLARHLGVSQQAVSLMLRSKRVKAEHAIRIEDATGGQVRRADLRPDLFGAAT